VNSIYADQGVEVAPIIENGIIYLLSQSQVVYALNAATGSIIWQKPLPVTYCPTGNYNCVGVEDSHAGAGTIRGLPTGHYHDGSWAYTTTIYNQPLLWVDNNNYTIFAFNALTGTQVTKFAGYNGPKTIPGNYGLYDNVTPEMTIDEANNLMMVGVSVTENVDAGRGAVLWYSTTTNPPTFKGFTFLTPPGNSPQGWSLSSVQNMTNAWIFNGTGFVNLKTLPTTTLSTMLLHDWGTYGFNGTRTYAGASIGFGGPEAFDSAKKVFYLATSQSSPDYNATYRPGPDLWASSVLAINETTLTPIWGAKLVAHDLWDYDCSWNVMLANITVSGVQHEAVMKGCKSGYVVAMDAKTGAMLWSWTSAQNQVKRGLFNKMLNPLNQSDMTKQYANYPAKTFYVNNPTATGSQESNIAYDPTTNLMFAAQFNNPSYTIASDVLPGTPAGYKSPSAGTCPSTVCVKNTTLSAVDASTGLTKWSLFVPGLSERGGVAVSNGVVYFPGLDGFMRFVNEQTGALIKSVNIGGPAGVQTVLGQDASNNPVIVQVIGNSEEFAGANPLGEVPGFVVEYALTTPLTSTSTATVTQSGSTATVTQSGSTATVTQSGSTATQTSTLLSTITGAGSGVSSTTLYGVAAVAVIFAVTTGFFALRGRGKPAA